MAQSGGKTERLCINWEQAFDLYLNAIACENEVLWVQATSKLAKWSKHAPEDLLARTVPILVELLRRIPSTDLSPSIQEAAAQCLKSVACQGEGRLAVLIGESGAIPSILSLLTHSEGSLRRALLKCLRNIVTFAADNRVIVATHGGLQIILNLLNTCSDDLKRYLLDDLPKSKVGSSWREGCRGSIWKQPLYPRVGVRSAYTVPSPDPTMWDYTGLLLLLLLLALVREVRRTILISGGIGFLVESARCGSMISRCRAAQAIGLLGLVKRVRRTLVDSGTFSVLLELVQVGDTSTKLVAANALGVISSHVDYIRPLANAGAIPLYAELLQGTEPMGYKHLPSVVRDSGAIPILVQLLEDQSSDVREKVSGAIAQLSYNEADRAALANSGAILHG